MNPDEFVSITRGLVRRGWSEIEPKIAASAASGGLFGILVNILASYHVPITPEVKAWGPYLIAIIGGYIFPSSGQIITVKSDDKSKTTTTATVGGVQTIVTGSIPVQSPAPVSKTAPDVPLADLVKNSPSNARDDFLAGLKAVPSDAPTQVIR